MLSFKPTFSLLSLFCNIIPCFFKKITVFSKNCDLSLHQFEGLHKLWDTPQITVNFIVYHYPKFLGFSTSQSIYHWFSGRNMPTIDNLYALSDLFHVPVDSMLCGSQDDKWYFIGHNSCHRLLLYYEKLS